MQNLSLIDQEKARRRKVVRQKGLARRYWAARNNWIEGGSRKGGDSSCRGIAKNPAKGYH
jgi:hypothetical protein